jgi:molybdopterin-synthase adenylyltransferase
MKNSMLKTDAIIKFKNQDLNFLRENLLKDLKNEQYACLICKIEVVNNHKYVMVKDIKFPKKSEIKSNTITSLKIDGLFAQNLLEDIDERFDVDTLIEVHTHPFSKNSAIFSHVDDSDEMLLRDTIKEHYPGISYGSIVLSQTEYSARLWLINGELLNEPIYSKIQTQKLSENIRSSIDFGSSTVGLDKEGQDIFNRSELLYGRETLQKIMDNQTITIIGVGGIGSVIAENLVHMGFTKINLVDNDKAELSNLNRLVGLKYQDAVDQKLKVDLIKDHLLGINPKIEVDTFPSKIEDIINDSKEMTRIVSSDWIIMATDNHYSRYLIQQLCFKYYIPFISVGVNISFKNNKLYDISGETILVRMGDKVCLSCLNRIDSNEVQKVLSHDPNVREGLVHKGYVKGADVKEPAVKTLNSIMGSITTDVLMNEYTGLNKNYTITVYENNKFPRIYNDDFSVKNRKLRCSVCDM